MKCTEATSALQNWRKEKENKDLEELGAQLQYALGNEQQCFTLLIYRQGGIEKDRGRHNL